MLANYLKVALRNILRQKFYAAINILGLAIGLSICLIILLFVVDEISYDRYHQKADRIYRVLTDWQRQDDRMTSAISEYRLAIALETDFPELERVVRFSSAPGSLVRYRDTEFQENRIFFADAGAFDMFDFELIMGDREKILTDPFTILLSESTARKYFGDQNPVGESLRFNDQYEAAIAGVFRDIPDNSHFHADIFIAMETGKQVFNNRVLNNWGELFSYTYVLLPEKMDPAQIEARFPAFLEKNIGETASKNRSQRLQPLTDIHLHSHYFAEIESNSDIKYLYIAGAIALFIILIACINYMNLATARSAKRATEIGVRKTLGADRTALIGQFIAESVLVSLVALILAFALALPALPAFNSFAEKSLVIDPLANPGLYLVFFGLTVVVGLTAGSYPAFYLSSLDAQRVFRERSRRGSSSAWLRKGLVIFQYGISIILIIATIIVFNQWSFLRNKDLGYDRENLLIVPLPGDSINDYYSLKQQLEQSPDILSVTASNKRLTGALSSNLSFKAENFAPDPQTPQSIKVVTVDHDFMKTLQPEFVAGRDFDLAYGSDAQEAFILNEAAVRMIGWQDDPIGKWFETSDLVNNDWSTKRGKIIGVVKDFNMESLYNQIEPVVYFISQEWLNWMTIRLRGGNVPQTIAFIKDHWMQYGAEQQFEYTFLDDQIAQLYRNEERFFTIFTIFTVLAIFIASLGILGLSAYTAEQRTKEIGVRKVFGASTGHIIALLLREFTYLVLIGFVAAAPIAFLLMRNWLQDFTYRIDIGPWPFVLAVAIAVSVAWLTAGLQSARAAMRNPVRALRYE